MLPQWGSVTRRSVRRSHPDVYLFVAAAATDATTMSRPPYRGGRSRGRGRRGFSDRPYNGGGRGELVSGDSHFRSVREANLGLTEGIQGGSFTNKRPHLSQRPPPPHYGSQQFRSPPPRPFDRSQPFLPSAQPPFDRNQAIQRPPQPYPRPPKALNYRTWEFAEMAPPPNCEKFVVLSYNILADYLAMSHRPKLYSHVPWHMLNWEWRKSNIIFELGLWSADVMCFQEVDRFQELEEEFKLWGYRGIWKMRTGNAVDGCAIFWRTSRFKLVYEECIEFNKLSLRDNVAQICVFELLHRNYTGNVASPPTSSAGSNRVIVCNIHVLYNPKRGDFKLGQVRMLLDRAHALSKIWNNAPVVLCGDFNCTPKSPLYNFILEQKLDLSGVDRDKVSGQASVEIRAPKRYSRLNSGTQPADSSPQTPLSEDCKQVDVKLTDYLSNVQNENNSNLDMLNLPSINNLFQLQCTEAALDVFNKSSTDMQCGNKVSASCDVKEETAQHELDNSKGETGATFFVPIGGSQESTSCVTSEDGFPINKMNDEIHTLAPLLTSPFKDDLSDLAEMGQRVKDEATFHSKHGSPTDDCSARAKFNPESLKDCNSEVSSQEVFCQTTMCDAVEASHTGSTEILSSHSNVHDDNCSSSAPYRINTSRVSSEVDLLLDKKLENLYLKEPDAAMMEAEGVTEDDKKFLSALHDNEDAFPLDSGQSGRLNFDHSPNEFASDQYKPRLKSPSDEVLDDFSLGLDSEATNLEKTGYDPSLWTPMEIATATGNPESMLMEHFLQLKSTYAEVEDCSKTRDSNGEPLVTSYNRCFMGTVDYIWRSEGLQTVKVLAPIPKDAMKWTPGFPTKKWGSDHIALAAELAFIEAPEMR